MKTLPVAEKKVFRCRRCGNAVTTRKVRKQKEVLVDVFHDDTGHILVTKNSYIVEHRCN